MSKIDPSTVILDAASKVLNERGLSGATLDAIAAEAGMTKGGVLYYFPGKQALLVATIKHYENRFYAKRREVLAGLPQTPANLLRATVTVMLAYYDNAHHGTHSGVAVIGHPLYEQAVYDFKKRVFGEIFALARDKEKVAAVLYILDGIWINKLFDPPTIPPEYEKQSIQVLMELVDSCA